MSHRAIREKLVGFDKNLASRIADPDDSHVDDSEDGKGSIFFASRIILGIGLKFETRLAMVDLEPQIAERFGAGNRAPGGDRVEGEVRSNPIGERLGRREDERRRGGRGRSHGNHAVEATAGCGKKIMGKGGGFR